MFIGHLQKHYKNIIITLNENNIEISIFTFYRKIKLKSILSYYDVKLFVDNCYSILIKDEINNTFYVRVRRCKNHFKQLWTLFILYEDFTEFIFVKPKSIIPKYL